MSDFNPETPLTTVQCLHCETHYEGNFCHTCGQKATTHRFSLKDIGGEIFHHIFPLDRGFLFTFRELLLRPGKMIRGYLSGKRAFFSNPINYLLIVTAIATIAYVQFFDPMMDKVAELGLQPNNSGNFMKKFMKWTENHYTLFLSFMVPFYAFATKIIYRKHSYNLAEHFVINSYLMAQYTLFSVVLLPLTTYLPAKYIFFTSFFSYTYLGWMYVKVFEVKPIWKSILKPILSLVLSFVLLEIAFIAIMILAFFVYWGIFGIAEAKAMFESLIKK